MSLLELQQWEHGLLRICVSKTWLDSMLVNCYSEMVSWLASPPVDCYWTPLIEARPPVFHNFHYSIIWLFLLVHEHLSALFGSAFYSSIVGYEEKKNRMA